MNSGYSEYVVFIVILYNYDKHPPKWYIRNNLIRNVPHTLKIKYYIMFRFSIELIF